MGTPNDVIYHSPDLVITRDFIRFKYSDRETIPINTISEIRITRSVVGDHKKAATFFFLLGILSFWFLIGFLFLAFGVAAYFTKIYSYQLTIFSGGTGWIIKEGGKKGTIKSMAQTIRGLATSAKILSATASQ